MDCFQSKRLIVCKRLSSEYCAIVTWHRTFGKIAEAATEWGRQGCHQKNQDIYMVWVDDHTEEDC